MAPLPERPPCFPSGPSCRTQPAGDAAQPPRGLRALHVGQKAQEVPSLVNRLETLTAVVRVLPPDSIPAAVEQRAELHELLVAGRRGALQFVAEPERLTEAIRVLGGEVGAEGIGGRHGAFGREENTRLLGGALSWLPVHPGE